MPPLALPPPDFPLPVYIRRAESKMLLPQRAILPGLMMPPGLMAVSGPTGLTLVASATGSSGTVTIPADSQAGDLLVISGMASGSSGDIPPAVHPAGFTQIASVAGQTSGSFNSRMQLHFRIADGSEAGTTRSALWICRCDVFRGSGYSTGSAKSPVTALTYQGANMPSRTITSGGGASPLVVLAAWRGGNAYMSRTPAETGVVGTTNLMLGYWLYDEEPENVVLDGGSALHGMLVGGYVELG